MIDFTPVPPPAQAPENARATELGLPRGLRVDRRLKEHGPWRCGGCYRTQHDTDEMVWVPDGVKVHDSRADVEELVRLNAFNGQSTAWCVKCCTKRWGKRR